MAGAIPLHRRGQWYTSLDEAEVPGGGRIGLAPAVLVAADARAGARRPAGPDRQERVRLLTQAVRLFATGTVDLGPLGPQSAARFHQVLERTAGLPSALTERWIGMLRQESANAVATSPENEDEDEDGSANRHARSLVSLPANTFTCLEAVFRAVLDSDEVWLRPSRREPWSALRLTAALLQAGWPADRLGFYPTGAEVLPALLDACDHAVVFGGEDLRARFAGRPGLDLRGPGRGLALVGTGADPAATADWLLPLLAADAGRFCKNVCTVLCEDDPAPLSRELARRLDAIALDPVDPALPQAAVVDRAQAEATARAVLDRLDGSARLLTRRPLLQTLGSGAFLAPGLVLLDGDPAGHPLLALELPFPFASIARTDPRLTAAARGRSLFVHEREPFA